MSSLGCSARDPMGTLGTTFLESPHVPQSALPSVGPYLDGHRQHHVTVRVG
jgi:hypothetical protein